ncbi:MAG: mechanosensitive ion channel [Holosporaceae bacterium]|nr:MAG: mechanosensitive ion channel [Holosporaceae bacterium]
MIQTIHTFCQGLGIGTKETAVLTFLASLLGIAVVGYVIHKILGFLFFTQFKKYIKRNYPDIAEITDRVSLFKRLLMFVVPLILMIDLSFFLGSPEHPTLTKLVGKIEKILGLYLLVLLGMLLSTLINAAEHSYNKFNAKKGLPVRSYAQSVKLILFIIFGILVISKIMDKSPITFLTGLAAGIGIISVIFKDAILSFIASFQLVTSRMMKVGDWIEIPGKDISGNIIEMSLNTVKIQNFDKTISTLPPYYLVSNAVKNYQGMFDFGARRIKKSFNVDAHTIKFIDGKTIQNLKKIPSLSKHLKKSESDLLKAQITNMTLFRQFIENILENDARFSKDGVIFMVRVIQPSPEGGVPLEIYTYTKDTNWKNHEHIQAELIETVIANMGYFDLKLLQHT